MTFIGKNYRLIRWSFPVSNNTISFEFNKNTYGFNFMFLDNYFVIQFLDLLFTVDFEKEYNWDFGIGIQWIVGDHLFFHFGKTFKQWKLYI